MSPSDTIFHRAVGKLLVEVVEGSTPNEGYILNPGDPGLLGQLETIDARAASTRDVPGKTTIAAHVDHVNYGISLLNRWARGEENPWATADWEASWKRGVVSDAQWRTLRDTLRSEYEAWRDHAAARTDWNDVSAAGAVAIAAHTAYHLGAIRQILATLG